VNRYLNRTSWVLAGLAATLTACSSTDTPSGTGTDTNDGHHVVTKLLSFEPQKLTVAAGTTVTWTVSDSIAHTVTTGTFTLGGDDLRTSEDPDGVVDLPLSPGHDVTYTFSEPGTYSYFCSIHKGMTGEVEVTP